MGREPENGLIVSAASEEFGPSLLALLGSIRLNWPEHPPILVYDIGLDSRILGVLEKAGVSVRKVPPFCPHWRDHFTWKLWCLNDAPALNILWMDAGLVVLKPLDEIFEALDRQGYFLTTNYESLEWEASEEACAGCAVSPEFRRARPTLAATLMAFHKGGRTLLILEEALSVALDEKHIAATQVAHRHDQAILSILAYKHLGRVVIADGAIYLAKLSPRQVPGQKIWVHRGVLRAADYRHLAAHLLTPGDPYVPTPPFSMARARARALLYKVYWHFGQGHLAEALEQLETAFREDPGLSTEPGGVARVLFGYHKRLQAFAANGSVPAEDFAEWGAGALRGVCGRGFVRQVRGFLCLERAAEAQRAGNPREWRRWVIRALRNDPLRGLTNSTRRRLLLGVLGALLGSNSTGRWRRLGRRRRRHPGTSRRDN